MGSDSRKATVKQRMYPETAARLADYAAARGLDCAAALDDLVPRETKADPTVACRHCGKLMENPRHMSDDHEPGCVLRRGDYG